MQPFLSKTADYIFSNFSGQLNEICIVFPNRRAGLFFRKYLSGKIEKNIFLPSIFSTEEFITKLSGLQIIDPTALLFELFEVYSKIEKENAGTFDDYLSWAQQLLHDFNDTDLYLIKPDELFGYLNEAKALKLWNPDGNRLTPFEIQYLKFYKSFLNLYNELKTTLLSKQLAYQGLAYRQVAENLPNLSVRWKKIIFAGFNALTTSEEKIIKYFYENDTSIILWDTDNYYLEDKIQEAGNFIRNYQNNWLKEPFLWKENNFKNNNKNINIIGVPQNILQAKVCGQIIEEFSVNTSTLNNTAIVFADESILVPVLNSMPGTTKKYNVTMGYPLQNTPIYDLIDSIFTLHENASDLSQTEINDKIFPEYDEKFYFRDVLKILLHPYLRQIIDNTKDGFFSAQLFLNGNRTFYNSSDIYKLFSSAGFKNIEFLLPFFDPWSGKSLHALESLICVIDNLKSVSTFHKEYNSHSDSNINIETEYLFAFAKLLKRLRSLIYKQSNLSIKTLHKIYSQLALTITLPFFGEPLSGIQLMGMLESRNLDFENIILLSANEDKLPAGKISHSFIPFDIRKEFKLPTYQDHNAIFAYHFYRLIQRASNVFLIYNSQANELGGGEKSRFITQLQNELLKVNPHCIIKEELLSLQLKKDDTNFSIQIPKTNEIINLLNSKFNKGLSATSLLSYILCPLQFYFKEIALLGEPEEVEETINAATMGKIAHLTIETMFEPFIGKPLTSNIIKQLIPESEKTILNKFKNKFKYSEIPRGKNLLIIKVINSFISKYLHYELEQISLAEKKLIPMSIQFLEKNISIQLPVPTETNNKATIVNLKGFIDRVDKIGNYYRIIDYKTGTVKQTELKVTEWDQLITDSKYGKAFQLMIYLYLFNKQFPTLPLPEAGIISFRNLSRGFLKLQLPEHENIAKTIKSFENILCGLISDINNIDIPFSQTPEPKNCINCNYKSICNR